MELPLHHIINEQRKANGLQIIPVELEHVLALQSIPARHKDPFDRMLIAQAQTEHAVLISKDGVFSKYRIDIVW